MFQANLCPLLNPILNPGKNEQVEDLFDYWFDLTLNQIISGLHFHYDHYDHLNFPDAFFEPKNNVLPNSNCQTFSSL